MRVCSFSCASVTITIEHADKHHQHHIQGHKPHTQTPAGGDVSKVEGTYSGTWAAGDGQMTCKSLRSARGTTVLRLPLAGLVAVLQLRWVVLRGEMAEDFKSSAPVL